MDLDISRDEGKEDCYLRKSRLRNNVQMKSNICVSVSQYVPGVYQVCTRCAPPVVNERKTAYHHLHQESNLPVCRHFFKGEDLMNRIIIAVVVLILVLFVSAFAQQEPQKQPIGQMGKMGMMPGMMHGQQGGLMGGMKLTDEQLAKIQDLRLSHQKEVLPLRTELQKQHANLKLELIADKFNESKVKSIQGEISKLMNDMASKMILHQRAVRDLLTPEQKKQFDQHILSGGPMGPEGMMGQGGMMEHGGMMGQGGMMGRGGMMGHGGMMGAKAGPAGAGAAGTCECKCAGMK